MAYNFAYTIPFPEDTKITKEQAFEALRIKCREPQKFVPAFAACDVLEETPTFIKRKVTTKAGGVMIESIDLHAPSMVVFRGENGTCVTNVISETAAGHKFLTFAFSMIGLFDFVPGDGDEDSKREGFKEMATVGTDKSLETILEMFANGKLDKY